MVRSTIRCSKCLRNISYFQLSNRYWYYFQIHIRGGSILPLQDPGLTTVESRHNVFSLLIALDGNGDASGDLYVDDGESLDVSKYIMPSVYLQLLTYAVIFAFIVRIPM